MPRPSSSSLLFARLGAVALAWTAVAVFGLDLPACGSSPRLGAAGDSCTKTDDCESPLTCTRMICTDPNQPPDGGAGGMGGAGGSTGSSSASSTSVSATVSGSTGSGKPFNACDICLKMTCAKELGACDDECVAIEACLETVCTHLSALGAMPDEGECQTKCQGEHAASKDKHLALVNCVIGATVCLPPCVPYPDDFTACVAYQDKVPCAASKAACKASPDCQKYQDCVSACSTYADCIACDDTPSGLAGRQLLETYEHCVSAECIAVSWIPPI
jgi:hypothetical protein